MHKDLERVLFTEDQIKEKVKEIAEKINRDYEGKEIHFICILRGAYIYMADLQRQMSVPNSVDFMVVSSYGSGSESSGKVQIQKDLVDDIRGKHVIVVEDILDSGNTLYTLLPLLKQRGAASVKLTTLLDKPSRREKPVKIDYPGFQIPDAFVVGYGLDFDEKYRYLPYIGVLKPSIYSEH